MQLAKLVIAIHFLHKLTHDVHQIDLFGILKVFGEG
jgi:hypothetical protein